jgi:hypothetical protein
MTGRVCKPFDCSNTSVQWMMLDHGKVFRIILPEAILIERDTNGYRGHELSDFVGP